MILERSLEEAIWPYIVVAGLVALVVVAGVAYRDMRGSQWRAFLSILILLLPPVGIVTWLIVRRSHRSS